jgi:hypothetical protein
LAIAAADELLVALASVRAELALLALSAKIAATGAHQRSAYQRRANNFTQARLKYLKRSATFLPQVIGHIVARCDVAT